MKVIKFVKDHSPYIKGEVASFADEDADVRIQAGVATLVKTYKIQPDQRTQTKFDEFGNAVVETHTVPDDLQRNVDLPQTEAGGTPKDEAHMTDEEKKRLKALEKGENPDESEQTQAKSIDAPRENKMVKNAPAKK